MVYPVVHALRASAAYRTGRLAIDVLALPAAMATLAAHGVDCLSFRNFLDPSRDQAALQRGRHLAETQHSATLGVGLDESVAYLGLSYQDLVLRLGEASAAELFASRGRQAFFPLTVMQRVFDRLRPDFVVATNSPRAEAAAIATANERGIDNLIITDLFTGLGGYVLKGRHITFLNEVARDTFVANGLADGQASRLYCTGNPAFDGLLSTSRVPEPGWLQAQFPGLAGEAVVLHADVPAYWDSRNACSHERGEAEVLQELEACWNACRANGLAYLVRPHPSQHRGLYERWIAGRERAWLAASCDLHRLLVHIDLLVARTTTVGLQAAILNRPVLQLDWESHKDMPLAAMGMAWGCSDMAELADDMRRVLADDAARQRIAQRARQMVPPEPAAPKVAAILLEQLGLGGDGTQTDAACA